MPVAGKERGKVYWKGESVLIKLCRGGDIASCHAKLSLYDLM